MNSQLWFEKAKGVFSKNFIFVMVAFFGLTLICVLIGLFAWVAKLVFKIDTPDWLQSCENLFFAEHRVGLLDMLIASAIGAAIALIVSFVFSIIYAIVLVVKKP